MITILIITGLGYLIYKLHCTEIAKNKRYEEELKKIKKE